MNKSLTKKIEQANIEVAKLEKEKDFWRKPSGVPYKIRMQNINHINQQIQRINLELGKELVEAGKKMSKRCYKEKQDPRRKGESYLGLGKRLGRRKQKK